MEKGILSTLAMASMFGFGMMDGGSFRRRPAKGRWGGINSDVRASKVAKAARRKAGRVARKNRRLNIRRGKVHGQQ